MQSRVDESAVKAWLCVRGQSHPTTYEYSVLPAAAVVQSSKGEQVQSWRNRRFSGSRGKAVVSGRTQSARRDCGTP